MNTKEVKEKYCKEFGYSSFNKHNESDYSKWLEKELINSNQKIEIDLLESIIKGVKELHNGEIPEYLDERLEVMKGELKQ